VPALDLDLAESRPPEIVADLGRVVWQHRQHFKRLNERRLDQRVAGEVFFPQVKPAEAKRDGGKIDQPGADDGRVGVIQIPTGRCQVGDLLQRVSSQGRSLWQDGGTPRVDSRQFSEPDCRLFAFTPQADQLNLGLWKAPDEIGCGTEFDCSATGCLQQLLQKCGTGRVVFQANRLLPALATVGVQVDQRRSDVDPRGIAAFSDHSVCHVIDPGIPLGAEARAGIKIDGGHVARLCEG